MNAKTKQTSQPWPSIRSRVIPGSDPETRPSHSSKTQFNHRLGLGLAIIQLVVCFLASNGSAQTLANGAVDGTWNPSGNPYILSADTWIPSGQTLTIMPGVEVKTPPNTRFEVFGTLIAKGTPSQRIAFTSANSTTFWDGLIVDYSAGDPSKFTYCDFDRAPHALTLQVINQNTETSLQVYNCTFSDCTDFAILGFAHGRVYQNMAGFHFFRPTLHVDVRNCLFQECPGAIKMRSEGTQSVHSYYGFVDNLVSIHGHLLNNIYKNISGTALLFEAEAHTDTASASSYNSVFSGVETAVHYSSEFSVDVKNCIIADSMTGLVRDTPNGSASYNCFWNCGTPFTGYSPNHGVILLQNDNGTPCDIAFNIFSNPQFRHDSLPFDIDTTSPCIDAGDPNDESLVDVLFQDSPSKGQTKADQGAYGGADAWNWFESVPLICPDVDISRGASEVTLHWSAIPRNSYLIHEGDDLRVFTPLPVGVLTPEWHQASHSVPKVPNGKCYFKIEHLGRAPGD